MNRRTVTYTYDGDTFVGRYRLTNQGRGPTVSVEYEDVSRSATLGALPEEQVARALLGQLVRERFLGQRLPRSSGDRVLSPRAG